VNGKNHLRMGLLLIIFYLPFFHWWTTISLWELGFVILVTTLPDSDLKFEDIKIYGRTIIDKTVYHRNFLYHSIIIPAITLFAGVTPFKLLLCVSFGIHCISDISFKKKGGTFTIKWYKKGLNFEWTNVWLTMNFLISILLFILLI